MRRPRGAVRCGHGGELQAPTDLNGAAGVLIKWVAAVSRWAVTVVATDEKVKVRPDNLRRLASPTGPANFPAENANARRSFAP